MVGSSNKSQYRSIRQCSAIDMVWLRVWIHLIALIVDGLTVTENDTQNLTSDVATNPLANAVARYYKDDIVNKYRLAHRIDALGLCHYYIRDDHWDVDMLHLLLSNSSNRPFTTDSVHNLTHLHDIMPISDENIKFDGTCVRNGTFCLNENIFNGGHGEIWRAFRINEDEEGTANHNTSYILKRMRTKDRPDILKCAIREIYFGELLTGGKNDNTDPQSTTRQQALLFARYISYFTTNDDDYWLVFRDEGVSLQQSMYATVYSPLNTMLKPSQIWRNMRTTATGEKTMQGILYQLLVAVSELHSMNITHRDLKPSNILLNADDNANPRLLVADFSSAVSDTITSPLYNLYAPDGPTVKEETLLYAPPEVTLSLRSEESDDSGSSSHGRPQIRRRRKGVKADGQQEQQEQQQQDQQQEQQEQQHQHQQQQVRGEISYYKPRPASYDLWSIGVIFLELILGTAEVFSLDERSTNIITQQLRKQGVTDERAVLNAVLLSSLSDYCIYDPNHRYSFTSDEGSHDILANSAVSVVTTAAAAAVDMDAATTSTAVTLSDDMTLSGVCDDSSGESLAMVRTAGSCQRSAVTDHDSASTAASVVVAGATDTTTTASKGHPLVALTDAASIVGNSHLLTATVVTAPAPATAPTGLYRHLRLDYPKSESASSCDLSELSKAILRRDPLGRGFDSHWGLDLLSRFLKFDPRERISASDAMSHAYFTGPYISSYDNSEHATMAELAAHNRGIVEDYNPEYRYYDETLNTQLESSSSVADVVSVDTDVGTDINTVSEVAGFDGVGSAVVSVDSVSDEDGVFESEFTHVTEEYLEKYPILLFESDHCDADDSSATSAQSRGSQLANRRINTNQHAIIDGILKHIDFVCPFCNRAFPGQYSACYKHATSRKHAHHCHYDFSTLPPCLSDYALQPLDAQSGWCDLQGTRQYIEDVHAMYFNDNFNLKFFGVFDGHFGASAAKFAAKHVYTLFVQMLGDRLHLGSPVKATVVDVLESEAAAYHQKQEGLLDAINSGVDWRQVLTVAASRDAVIANLVHDSNDGPSYVVSATAKNVVSIIGGAFQKTHNQLLLRADGDNNLSTANSGTTATTVMLFQNHIAVAHVGDSRVIACCDASPQSRPVQLTLDHTPYSTTETATVESKGGWIDKSGSVRRVNGKLAVTRSIGDASLRHVLSAVPDVVIFRYRERWIDSNIGNNVGSIASSTERLHQSFPAVNTSTLHRQHSKVSFCTHYRQHAKAFYISRHSTELSDLDYASIDTQLLFLIVGSDGLWDVMTNYEASEFVCEYILQTLFLQRGGDANDGHDESGGGGVRDNDVGGDGEGSGAFCDNSIGAECCEHGGHDIDCDDDHLANQPTQQRVKIKSASDPVKQNPKKSPGFLPVSAFHEVSKLLAYEALVRGSSDNIGVCVIDLVYTDDEGEGEDN